MVGLTPYWFDVAQESVVINTRRMISLFLLTVAQGSVVLNTVNVISLLILTGSNGGVNQSFICSISAGCTTWNLCVYGARQVSLCSSF